MLREVLQQTRNGRIIAQCSDRSAKSHIVPPEGVKSRQRPNADVEDGHLSGVMCHLGNLSTRLGRSLTWDAVKERVTNDEEANKLLTVSYRKPWVLEGL